jgi:dTDP-4-dehydrorhamnose reductase
VAGRGGVPADGGVTRRTRFLVTGAGGQLGRELVAALDGGEVVAADHAALDVADRHAALQAVTALHPDVVVNAAAWTAVDACESDPDRAWAVNALGPRHLAEAARLVGAHVVHVSTDHVFDGTATRPYVEWDTPNPQSVYGRSKRGGELELGPGATLVRTSWVVGRHGGNTAKTVLRLHRAGAPLRFVDDQRGSPTVAHDLAAAVARLAVARQPGTFHVTNQGETTWHGFARAVVAAVGGDPATVEPIATADLDPPRPAPRPAMAVLDNAALRAERLPLLPDWCDSLNRLLEELAS